MLNTLMSIGFFVLLGVLFFGGFAHTVFDIERTRKKKDDRLDLD